MAKEISYFQYNDLLNEYFFDGKFANKPIYLDLETEVLASIGEKIGENSIYVEKNLPRVVANNFNLNSKMLTTGTFKNIINGREKKEKNLLHLLHFYVSYPCLRRV